jgi:choline dehydrogenase-like flavoprotein
MSSGLPSEKSTESFWHSEPSTLLKGYRSTRELPRQADVVIIGSGMTGTSAAHRLLTTTDENISIVLLEAREACWGATGRVCRSYHHQYMCHQKFELMWT